MEGAARGVQIPQIPIVDCSCSAGSLASRRKTCSLVLLRSSSRSRYTPRPATIPRRPPNVAFSLARLGSAGTRNCECLSRRLTESRRSRYSVAVKPVMKASSSRQNQRPAKSKALELMTMLATATAEHDSASAVGWATTHETTSALAGYAPPYIKGNIET